MKILLLSDLPPCTNHTAGLFLDKLCMYLRDSGCDIYAYIVKNEEVYTELPEDTKCTEIWFDKKPKENVGRVKNRVASRVYDMFCNVALIPAIEKRIVEFAKKAEVEMVWGVVQGQTMTKLIRSVANKCNTQYTVQFFDDISWWFQANRVDGMTQSIVLREYKRMIRDAYCFMGASEEMASEYAKKCGCKRHVGIMMPFDKGNQNSKKCERNDDRYIIAISGQLYARSTINALMEALAKMEWHSAEKQIVFRIYGPEVVFYGLKNAMIEYRGWLKQDTLLEELNEADLLYCPYRFDPDFEAVARYSFPGKLSTYMKTGVPILVHAPEYSSIVQFCKEYQCGYILDSIDPLLIKQKLEMIIKDAEYTEMVKRANETANLYLSDDMMKRKMQYAMGLRNSYME